MRVGPTRQVTCRNGTSPPKQPVRRLAGLATFQCRSPGHMTLCSDSGTVARLALQLQCTLEVSPSRHSLVASSPRGPSDDEGGLDPALC